MSSNLSKDDKEAFEKFCGKNPHTELYGVEYSGEGPVNDGFTLERR
jgi:hypothetical protein